MQAPMNADPTPIAADEVMMDGESVGRSETALQTHPCSSAAIGAGSAFIGASKAFCLNSGEYKQGMIFPLSRQRFIG
jgi:hypothetical protein